MRTRCGQFYTNACFLVPKSARPFFKSLQPPRREIDARTFYAPQATRSPLFSGVEKLKEVLCLKIRPHLPAGERLLYQAQFKIMPGPPRPRLDFKLINWMTQDSPLPEEKQTRIGESLERYLFEHALVMPHLQSWKPTNHEKTAGISLSLFMFVPAREPLEASEEHLDDAPDHLRTIVRELKPYLLETFRREAVYHPMDQKSPRLTLSKSDFKGWSMVFSIRHPMLQKSPLKISMFEGNPEDAGSKIPDFEPANPTRGRLRGIFFSHPDTGEQYGRWGKTRPQDSDLTLDFAFRIR